MPDHRLPTQLECLLAIVAAGSAREDLQANLRSLIPQLKESSEVAAVIVDNGVSESIADLGADEAGIALLRPETNLGYGRAVNRAYQSVLPPPRWIVACNSDLVFPPGSIETMVHLARSAAPRDGAIGPRLINPPGPRGETVQPSYGRFPTLPRLLLGRVRSRRMRKYQRPASAPRHVDWITGACLMIRALAFEEIGRFDEGFFLDYEDTDLCRRLADRGWDRVYAPQWQVIHRHPDAHSDPNPQRLLHTRTSLVRYLAKHRPAWELHAMGTMLRATGALRRKDHPFAPGWQAGLSTYRDLRSPATPPETRP